jgi:hypothetical protein
MMLGQAGLTTGSARLLHAYLAATTDNGLVAHSQVDRYATATNIPR